MARGVNKVIIIGNLGDDPKVTYMPSGDAVTNFTVATSESWKDKNTGEKKDQTEWHRVSIFGKLAEICGEYLRKGSKVFVDGSLRTRKWQDKDGNDRYTTEIRCSEMQMLDSKGDGQSSAPSQPQKPAQNRSANNEYSQARTAHQQSPVVDDFDDDIPF